MSILRNSLDVLLTQALVFGVTAGTYILVTRALGASGFGIYSLVIAFSALVANLVSLGLSYSNSCFIAKKKYSFAQLHANSLVLSAVLAALLSILYFLAGRGAARFLLKGLDPSVGWFSIAAIPFHLYYVYIQGIWVGREEIGLVNRLEGLKALAWFLATLLAYALFRGDITALLMAWLASLVVVAGVVFYVVCRQEAGLVSFRVKPFRMNPFSLASLKEVVGFGFKVSLSGLANTIHQRFGIFVVNYFLGSAAVGLYNLAVTLTENLWLIPTVVMRAAASRILGATAEESWQILIWISRSVLFALVGASALAYLATPVLIPLVYGSQYYDAVLPLKILLPGMTAWGLTFVITYYISGTLGRPGVTNKGAWLAMALNLGLCLGLIPTMGVSGAALSTSISYAAGLAFFLLFLSRGLHREVGQLFQPRIISSLRGLGEV